MTIDQALPRFLRKVTRHTLTHGGAAFQVNKSNNEFVLEALDFKNLKVRQNSVIQTININCKKVTTSIEKDRLLYIPAPKWIEGGLGFRATLNLIETINKMDQASFKLHLNSQDLGSGYSFKKFNNIQTLLQAKAGVGSGWYPGCLGHDKTTEYYFFLRQLRLKANQARLREFFIEKLNSFFAGSHNEFSTVQIKIDGLLSRSQCEDLLSQFTRGELLMKDIPKKLIE